MSSSDRGHRKPLRQLGPAAILVFSASLLATACTVQPLYGPSQSGASVAQTLRSITIDPVDSRVGQQVRNDLIFYLTGGGGEPSDPQYRMNLRTTSSETALGITREGSAPVYSVTVTASYTVRRISTDEIVLRETVRGTASYDRYSQNFANIRAKRDAENRAAAQAADEIRIRVAAATAVGF
jgi:LPS-assembly lipoprotein